MTYAILVLVVPDNKFLRCVTAYIFWTLWQVGKNISINYETNIIKSRRTRKTSKHLFKADVVVTYFLLRSGG